jgi:hypothetical protein
VAAPDAVKEPPVTPPGAGDAEGFDVGVGAVIAVKYGNAG